MHGSHPPEDHVRNEFAFASAQARLAESARASELAKPLLETLAACQRDLQVALRLLAEDRQRMDYQRKLAIAYEKLGDAQLAVGQGGEALESRTRSVDIARRLAAQEPDRMDYQRKLAIAHAKVADLQQALGNGAGALASATRSLQITQRVAAQDPGHADSQRKLAGAHRRRGRIAAGVGDAVTAHGHFSNDLRIARWLSAQQPASANASVDLAVSLAQLAGVDADPLPRRREATAILQKLKDEKRLTDLGTAVLAQLR